MSTTSSSSNDGSFEKKFKENDNEFVNRKGSSVGTIIKHKTPLIHQKYQSRSSSLTNRERKIMVAGLSSVLDLTDKSMESQRSLFTEEEWKRLTNYFNKEYHIEPKPLHKFLDSA
ncbi:hypothetical protein INT45_002924 [Circinella minor]|uniref:Uncharacterized protein n=1 Tax=Circinella minor TaxID=1195481 RepID=A0A8H7S958_9FUNG|nr:hypothetical protein INT45_002924 [Circinella minor]